MEYTISGTVSRTKLISVVFPAPDGAEKTNIFPGFFLARCMVHKITWRCSGLDKKQHRKGRCIGSKRAVDR
jgi:hypothetical protein